MHKILLIITIIWIITLLSLVIYANNRQTRLEDTQYTIFCKNEGGALLHYNEFEVVCAYSQGNISQMSVTKHRISRYTVETMPDTPIYNITYKLKNNTIQFTTIQ